MNSPKEQGQQEQKFRMGEQTIMIEAQWDGKIYYHRMNEILDAFPTATGFEIDGDALDFLTKDNGDLYVPASLCSVPRVLTRGKEAGCWSILSLKWFQGCRQGREVRSILCSYTESRCLFICC